jgi:hypothetical protein
MKKVIILICVLLGASIASAEGVFGPSAFDSTPAAHVSKSKGKKSKSAKPKGKSKAKKGKKASAKRAPAPVDQPSGE